MKMDKYDMQLLQDCLNQTEDAIDKLHLLLYFLEFNEGNTHVWQLSARVLQDLADSIEESKADDQDDKRNIFRDGELLYTFDVDSFIKNHFIKTLRRDIMILHGKATKAAKDPTKLENVLQKSTIFSKKNMLELLGTGVFTLPPAVTTEYLSSLQNTYNTVLTGLRDRLQEQTA